MSNRRDQKRRWEQHAEAEKGAALIGLGKTPTHAQTRALEACGEWAEAVAASTKKSSAKSTKPSTGKSEDSSDKGTSRRKKAARRR